MSKRQKGDCKREEMHGPKVSPSSSLSERIRVLPQFSGKVEEGN